MCHQLHCSIRAIPDYETLNNEHGDEPSRFRYQAPWAEGAIPFLPCNCVYVAIYNDWLNAVDALCCLTSVCTRTMTITSYESSHCMNRFMPQTHIKSVGNVIHRWLMTKKILCLHTLAMTLNYISWVFLELKGTTSYRPKSKCIYDLNNDGNQL